MGPYGLELGRQKQIQKPTPVYQCVYSESYKCRAQSEAMASILLRFNSIGRSSRSEDKTKPSEAIMAKSFRVSEIG